MTLNEYKPLVPAGGPMVAAGEIAPPGKAWGSDLGRLLRAGIGLAARYLPWVVGAILLGCVAGLTANMLMTPIYSAAGTLQIEPDQSRIVSVDQVVSESAASDSLAYYQTQYGLLRSRTLAERVALKAGVARLSTLESSANPRQAQAAAVARVLRSVTIRPTPGSRLVTIEYRDADPDLASRMVNLYIEEFIASTLDRRFEASSYARNFLEGRLEDLRTRIEETERELVAYAVQADILIVDGDAGDTGAFKALDSLTEALAEATRDRIRAEEQMAQFSPSDQPALVDNPLLQSLQTELSKARAEYEEQRSVFGPDYPGMQSQASRVHSLEGQLASETRRLERSLANNAQSEFRAAVEVERNLRTEIERIRGAMRDADRRSIDYNILKRDLDTNKTLYDGLLQRYREIGIAGGVGVNSVSVVDRATVPSVPVQPRPALNLMLGLLAGLSLATMIILILENWAQSIRNPEQASDLTGLPVVGVIPKFTIAGGAVVDLLSNNRSAATEAYHSLRANLQLTTGEGLPKSLFLTSSKPNEGKTTTSIAIATVLARTGLRVLLVDGDMRDPSLHGVFGHRMQTAGLSTLLQDEAQLAQVSLATTEPNLTLITAGPVPANAPELLSSPLTNRVFQQMEEAFDLVVIDGPPLLGLADAPLLSRYAASTLFVMASNSTSRAVVRRALDRLQAARARMFGIVLTKFDARDASYGGYSYEASYGDYAYSYGGGATDGRSKEPGQS